MGSTGATRKGLDKTPNTLEETIRECDYWQGTAQACCPTSYSYSLNWRLSADVPSRGGEEYRNGAEGHHKRLHDELVSGSLSCSS